jgi:hypothetical protein
MTVSTLTSVEQHERKVSTAGPAVGCDLYGNLRDSITILSCYKFIIHLPWCQFSPLKPSGSADLREMGCEDGRWMELAQDRIQSWALVLAVLNLGFCYHSLSQPRIPNFLKWQYGSSQPAVMSQAEPRSVKLCAVSLTHRLSGKAVEQRRQVYPRMRARWAVFGPGMKSYLWSEIVISAGWSGISQASVTVVHEFEPLWSGLCARSLRRTPKRRKWRSACVATNDIGLVHLFCNLSLGTIEDVNKAPLLNSKGICFPELRLN